MTVKVKSTNPESQGAFVVINAADFDETKHELYIEEVVAPAKEPVAPVDTNPIVPPADAAPVDPEVVAPAAPQPWAK